MKRLLFLFVFISTSFVFSQEINIDVPKIVIKLPIEETLQLNVGSVTFLEVLEDSRCPMELTCIWDGRARVRVAIQERGGEPYQKEIIFGELLEGETRNTELFSTDSHSINAIDLYPSPISEVDEEKEPFELVVHIKKN